MSQNNLPEPWLRGALPGVDALVAPLLYSFQQAREDLSRFTEGLTPDQFWARPYGLNPVGREIRHIGGSVDRLITYAEGKQLTDRQMRELSSEFDPGASREELLRELEERLARAEGIVRSLDPKTLTGPRAVGRKQLPTTAIGLLFHIAEHTQRHVGQAISAAKLARAAATGTSAA
jgi:uncharacterized damage-inducible protein DinB